MTDPIIKTVVVNAAPQQAFDIFVKRTASWWPLNRHAVSAGAGKAALGVVIETEVGGAVYEVMHDGARAKWGEVLDYEVGHHFAMSWHPGTDPDKQTRVEVKFEEHGQGQTKVTLTHSGWEVWAAEAQTKRDGYNSGWDYVFATCFADAVGK